MKLELRWAALCFLVWAPTAWAQQPSELDELRAQVAQFARVVCDPATPAEVRDLNMRRIERRQALMAPLIEQAIAAVKADAASSGELTAEDKADVDRTLLKLEDDLDEARLSRGTLPCPATAPGVQGAKLRSTEPRSASRTVDSAHAAPTTAAPSAASDPPGDASNGARNSHPPLPAPASDPRAAKAHPPDDPAPVSALRAATPATVPAQPPPTGSAPPPPSSSIFTRLLAGVDLSAASSLPTQQKFLLDFTINHPVHVFTKHDQDNPFSHWLWTWLDFRVTALPDQAAAALQNLGTTNDFFGTLLKNKNQQVVQGMEFLSGLEFLLYRPTSVTKHLQLSTALVFTVGATTPFSVPDKTQQEFNVNSTITKAFPGVVKGCKDAMGIAVDCSVIALLSSDRNRFFRQYYGGLRLKWYYLPDGSVKCTKSNYDVCDLFPGTFDVMLGQNELITAGKLTGTVLRLEGFYPLSFAPQFYVYATTWLHIAHSTIGPALVLEPTSPAVPLSSPNVFLQTLAPADRDFYRVGLGMDLIALYKSLKKTPAPSTPTTKP